MIMNDSSADKRESLAHNKMSMINLQHYSCNYMWVWMVKFKKIIVLYIYMYGILSYEFNTINCF